VTIVVRYRRIDGTLAIVKAGAGEVERHDLTEMGPMTRPDVMAFIDRRRKS
jgi:hypothetical protein